MARLVRIVQRSWRKIMRNSWSRLTCRALWARGWIGRRKHLPSRKRRKASSSCPVTKAQPTAPSQGIKDALHSLRSANKRVRARASGTTGWRVDLATQRANSLKHRSYLPLHRSIVKRVTRAVTCRARSSWCGRTPAIVAQ